MFLCISQHIGTANFTKLPRSRLLIRTEAHNCDITQDHFNTSGIVYSLLALTAADKLRYIAIEKIEPDSVIIHDIEMLEGCMIFLLSC